MSEQEKNLTEEEISAEETTPETEETPIEEVDEKDVKIAALEKEIAETKDQYMRTLAEYDNYRKRTAKEKLEAYGDAAAKTVTEMLAVIDNFDRAMAAECTDANFKNGMQMILNQYLDILKKLGVSEIEAEGKEFDPQFHNAVNQIEDENFGENTVAQVFQKGYIMGERVLRHAMVVVANP